MKILFVIAVIFMSLPGAFAQNAETSEQIIDQEIGPMSADDVNTLMSENGHESLLVCFAKDYRDYLYRAEGPRSQWDIVQERAVRKCENSTGTRCRAAGCKW